MTVGTNTSYTTNMRIAFAASFQRDEDSRVLATFRDLPQAAADGADLGEARAQAVDLLNSVLMFRMKYREDIPAPSKVRKGGRRLRRTWRLRRRSLYTCRCAIRA